MIEQFYQLFKKSTGVSTDTRTLKHGNLFFALKGSSFNGNKFATKALELGASCVVIDEAEFEIEGKTFFVNDVLTALQQLANFHRRTLKIPVIAIGGSNGKTTTKELTASVLSQNFKTFHTKGNLNNHIGVPLSLLSINEQVEIAIIELGANHLKETMFLCQIAEPTCGLITNNGKDHLEGYGSIDGVRKGNAELFQYLNEHEGMAFISSMQNDLMDVVKPLKFLTYGLNETDFVSGKILNSFPTLVVELKTDKHLQKVQSDLYGIYNLENVLAASCIGKYFGLSDEQIKSGIENYHPANNRSQIVQKDSNTFIMDCYNANPSSMKVALDSFEQLHSENKIVVLGDMFELGSFSKQEHLMIIHQTEKMNLKQRVFVGQEFSKLVKPNQNTSSFTNVIDAQAWFRSQKFLNTTFMLKASRGVAIEKILE